MQKSLRNAPVPSRNWTSLLAFLLLICSPGAQAAVNLQSTWSGDSTYTPGCTSSFTPDCAGSYTLVIENTGNTAETAAQLSISLPSGVSFDWACTPAGAGSSCGGTSNGSGASSLSLSGLALAASGGTLTYELTGYFDADLTADPLTIDTTVTDGGSTARNEDNELALSLHSVVSVDVQSTSSTYTPGDSGAYTIVVTNVGPSDVAGLGLSSSAPTGSSIDSWTCSGSGCPVDGSGNLNLTGLSLAAGATQTYAVDVDYQANANADPIEHSASISVPTAYADNTGTHSDSVSLGRDARTDFALEFSPQSPVGMPAVFLDYVPGTTGNALTLTVTNNGPSNAQAAALAMTLPAGVLASSSWSCDPAACSSATGSGNLSTSITLDAGDSVDVVLSIDYDSAASAATIDFSPTLTLDTNDSDDDTSDNSPTNTYSRKAEADYGVSFTPTSSDDSNPALDYVPGTSNGTLDVVLENTGPSDGAGVDLTLTLPVEVIGGDWSCTGCTPSSGTLSGTSLVVGSGSLAADAQRTLHISNLAFHSAAVLEVIEFQASIARSDTAEEDDQAGNDSASNYYAIDRQADIELTKVAYLQASTPATEVARGNGFYYDITVTNHGPTDIGRGAGDLGVTISDSLDPRLVGDTAFCGEDSTPCWEFCPNETGPGTIEDCTGETATGSGSSLAGVALMIPANASRVVRVHVASALTTSDGEVIDNTATASVTDTGFTLLQPAAPNETPDSDSASVTVRVQSNLSVEITDAATTAVPGVDHSYSVTVRNDGFVHVNAVPLDAALPVYAGGSVDAGFVGGSIQWQCSAFDGACCNSNSSNCGVGTPTSPITANSLDGHLVDLPAGSRVEFTATGRIDSRASGNLYSEASITVPAGTSDSDPVDNDSVDDDTMLVPEADLLLDKRLVSIERVDGEIYYHLVYSVDVENRGPSRAVGVHVNDPLSDGQLLAASALWCSVTPGSGATDCSSATPVAGVLDTTFDLAVDGRRRFLIETDTVDAPSGQITNKASLDWETVSREDSVIANIGGTVDIEVTNTDGRSTAIPGTANEYVIRVANHGPSDVFGAQVTDLFAPQLENVSWTCSAITPIPGDLGSPRTAGPGASAGASLVTTNDGRHVYQLVDMGGVPTLLAYTRDNVPGLHFGELTELETETNGVDDPGDSGNAVSGMLAPVDIAISTNSARIYVLSNDAGGSPATAHLVMFNRITNPADPGYGKISFATSVPVNDANPQQVVVANHSLYVSSDDGVRMFTLDPSSGLPTEDELTSLADIRRMAVSPAQNLLFVAAAAAPELRMYAMGVGGGSIPAGRLSELDSLGDTALGDIADLRHGPEGAQLYAIGSSSGTLAVVDYELDGGTGSLSPGTSYVPADFSASLPADAFERADSMAIAPDGEHLLVVIAGSSQLLQLRRDTVNGTLTYDALPSRSASSGDPADAIRITSDGRHVLIAMGTTTTPALEVLSRRAPDPRFAQVEVDRQGDLPGPVQGINAPADIAASPDGKHLYSVSLGGDHALAVFSRHDLLGQSVDSAGQHLQFVTAYFDGVNGVQGLGSPRHVLVSPNGDNVYVTSADDDSLAVFARDPNSGLLTFSQLFEDGQGGVTALLGATGMTMDAGSSHLYVAAENEQAIAIFRNNAGTLSFVGEARAGVAGALGLERIRDLTLSNDGTHLIGVSRGNTGQGQAVVFTREAGAASPDFGKLRFLQAVQIGAQLPTAISLSRGNNPGDDQHVYISAEGSHEIVVMSRIIDPGSPDYGKLLPRFEYLNDAGGISHMRGPKDIKVSRDGRKVYVAAASSNAVLVFDRDANRSSSSYGALTQTETRRDNLEGVDGIGSVYALAISPVSAFVYAAGFSDAAIASFQVGSGSSCSASGSGPISDLVNIANDGVLEYRANTLIRADASGEVRTEASVELPDQFVDGTPGNNAQEDLTMLAAAGDLSITKTNNQVSVVGGDVVRYEMVVRNAGPSNLGDPDESPVTVSDLLDENPGFVSGSASWTCLASNSGSLAFEDAQFDGDPGITGLAGASGITLISASGNGEASHLAVAGVLDDAITVFEINPGSGALDPVATIAQGDSVDLVGGGSTVLGSLEGARAVVASDDGEFLYVASRTSDSVTVFALDDSAATLVLRLVQVQTGAMLNQAQHLVLSTAADQPYLYVAAANADNVAVYARDPLTGALSLIETEVDGQDDPADDGGMVSGLDNVEYLTLSPDALQLYALSASSASISRFDIDPASGRLNYRSTQNAASFGIAMDGVSGARFDADGRFLYLAATQSDRLLVLERDKLAGSNFGRLSYRSSVTQGTGTAQGLLGPRHIALSADGQHLYVTSQTGDALAWYLRDPLDGSLGYLGQRSNSSGAVTGLAGASGLVLDERLGQVYAVGSRDGAVTRFRRQADSHCPPSGTGSIDEVPVRVAAGGSVTFLIDVQVSPALSGDLINTASVDSPADSTPANNEAEDVDPNSSQADLSITKDDGLAEYDGLAGAVALAGDHRNLYVAGAEDNAIGMFRRTDDPGQAGDGDIHYLGVLRNGEDGTIGLAAVSDLALGGVAGEHLYAVSPDQNSVSVFRRSTVDGRLTYLESEQNGVLGVAGLSGARALTVTADGGQVYVLGGYSNAIAVFARDNDNLSADFGKLAYRHMLQNGVADVSGMGAPAALAVAPDGKHVYVLGSETDSIAVFQRNPNPGSAGFGDLTFLESYSNGASGIFGMEGVRSLAFTDNTNLQVLAAGSGRILHFERAADGSLELRPDDVRDGVDGVTGLAGASRLRLTPDGNQLYVASAADAALLWFDVAGDGSLGLAGRLANGDAAPSTGGQVLGLDGVAGLVFAPDGERLYAVSATDEALDTFQRATGDGALDYLDSLFDGLGGIAPGETVTYRIRVRNDGPSDTRGRVVDHFPDAFVSASWTCTAAGTAACPGSGSGNLDVTVDLPVGSSVQFLASGVIGENASGYLVNTATVSALDAIDPDETDNSATDGDTVLSPATDLVVDVDDGQTEAVPGATVSYQVQIANVGPSYANDVRLQDVLPAALHDVSWTCSATPIAGGLTGFESQPDPLDSYSRLRIASDGLFAYAIGSLGGVATITRYRRDPLTGLLSDALSYANGSGGISGMDGASDLLLGKDGRFIYVAGTTADTIVLLERNATTGELDFVARYADGEFGVSGIGGVISLAMAPGGEFLYAAGSLDDAIAIFAVNAVTGELTQTGEVNQGQSGMNGLNGVRSIVFNEDASRLFAVASDNASLAAFERNPGNGGLTLGSVLEDYQLPAVDQGALTDPRAVAVHDGTIVTVSGSSGQVAGFSLTEVGGEDVLSLSWRIDTVSAPIATAFDPDQARLYVAGGDGISLFSLQTATPQSLVDYRVADYPALDGLATIEVSPNRRQLYSLGNATGEIGIWQRERGSRCALGGQGALTLQQVDIAPAGVLDITVQGMVFANATGSLLYSVTASPRSTGEELNPNDNSDDDSDLLIPAPDLSAIKSDGLAEVVAGESLTYQIDFANAGVSDALVALFDDPAPVFPVEQAGLQVGSGSWSCAANTPLVLDGGIDAGDEPALVGIAGMVRNPDGTRLYAASITESALLVFDRLPDGSLQPAESIRDGDGAPGPVVVGLAGASSVSMVPDGSQVLVTGSEADSLVVFDVDPASGALSYRQHFVSGQAGVSGLLGAVHVETSADGKWVVVAAPDSDSIALFRRDTATGQLQFTDRVRDGIGSFGLESDVIKGVADLRISRDSRFVYAVAQDSKAVSWFEIDPGSSMLSFGGVLRQGEAGLDGLVGADMLAMAPGDVGLYVLGDQAINLFEPQADGSLQWRLREDGIPGLAEATGIVLDGAGSRLYLADSDGRQRVFARDWSDGSLDLRFDLLPPGVGSAPRLAYAGDGDLYALSASGTVDHYREQAISRCLVAGGDADQPQGTVDLGVGGWAQVQFSATVDPSARGMLGNSAVIGPTDGVDPLSGDNVSTDTTQIIVVSDLAISKSGPLEAVAGETILYQIHVDNAGPSSALGATVFDDFADAIIGFEWTCTATQGSYCAASGSGSGDLSVPVDILPGGSVDLEVSALIDPAYLGELNNQASILPEPGASDPSPGDNDGSSPAATVRAEVDLAVSKDNGVDEVVAGTATSYQVTVTNAGPSDAPQVNIQDLLPAELAAISWTCTASGSGSCPSAGVGDLDFAAAIPAGEQLDIVVDAILLSNAEGTLVNTASADILDAAIERNPDNNQDSDSDTILVEHDVEVELTAGPDPIDPAGTDPLRLALTIHNNGPSTAHDQVLTLDFSAPVQLQAPEDCTLSSATQMRCDIGEFPPNGTRFYELSLTGLPPAPGDFTATAVAVAGDPDTQPLDNQDSITVTLVSGGDVQVSIDNQRRNVSPGDALEYVIVVENRGSQTVDDIVVGSPVQAEVLSPAWTCQASPGVTCAAGAGSPLADIITLARGQRVTYRLVGTVDPGLSDAMLPILLRQEVTADTPPGQDFRPANNTAVDEDLIFRGIFADGFEDALESPGFGSDLLTPRECALLNDPSLCTPPEATE